MSLYNSVVLGTLTYAIPLWGLSYTEIAERVHVQFFKRVLMLPQSTPDYIVRCESGSLHISLTILKHTLRWLLKVLAMGDNRYPLLCLRRLLELHSRGSMGRNGGRCWLTELHKIITTLGYHMNLEDINAHFLRSNFDLILDRYKVYLISEDLNLLHRSTHLDLYPALQGTNIARDAYAPQNYLLLNLPTYLSRFIAQIRTCHPNKFIRFYLKGIAYRIKCTELCSICNMHVDETLDHMLFECPVYGGIRPSLARLDIRNSLDLRKCLASITPAVAKSIFYCVFNMLKVRSLIMNE